MHESLVKEEMNLNNDIGGIMKALVLFGSESDKPVYRELISILENNFTVDFEVISAHRDPKRLDEKLTQNDFDIIFAGAGIAAHLPGVCASKTMKPVFGIPVEGNLSGLDALLSIMQMPFGIPVATMGSRKWDDVIKISEQIKSSPKNINIIVEQNVKSESFFEKEMSRTEKYLQESGIDYSYGPYNENILNINIVNSESDIEVDRVCFQVPILCDKRKNDPRTALELLEWSNKGGFWFGINNTRNAVCFSQKF